METQSQDRDIMASIALVIGALVLLAVVIFLVARLLSVIDKNSIKGGEKYAEEKQALVAERLQKIGSVKTASSAPADAAPAAARSGEQIVNGVCASCHGTGVLGAPKFKTAADWEPRYAQGLPTMLNNAINGLNSMPPKGGDASLSEAEVRSAIVYMLKDAGLDVADEAPAEPKAEAPAEAAPAAAVVEEVKETAKAVTEKAAEVVEETAEAATKLVDSAGDAVASAAGATVAAATGAVAAVTGDAEQAAEKAVAEAAAPAGEARDFAKGKEMYKQACFSCHDQGVAGAPKIGDHEAWVPRIATGADALYTSAINGKGAMPPKGGRVDASDDVIRETVDYMVSLSGG